MQSGTYTTVDGRPALRFERRLEHPVEAVWRAVTEPGELAHWFPAVVEIEGRRMTFTFPDGAAPPTQGEVTELDPPRRFAFDWGEDHLSFELEPSGQGCLLRFTCVISAIDRAARDAAGWHLCLDGLERRLAGMPTGERSSAPTDEWRERYEDYARRGLPTGAPIPQR